MTIQIKEQFIVSIWQRYQTMSPYLNERSRRIWAATEARSIGSSGQTILHLATGIDYKTIRRGREELATALPDRIDLNRVRASGGGRAPQVKKDKTLVAAVKKIVDPATRGDPERPLQWTSKSTTRIAAALNKKKQRASRSLVGRILATLGYSLQANRKTDEGGHNNPDRNEQFEHINRAVSTFQKEACPVLSVDTKKKENVGNYKNNGQEYRPKGQPEGVNVYDFIDKTKGKVAPYGVYDLTKNNGWVSVGISYDTAAFAVNSLRAWWYEMGRIAYGNVAKIMITADCGGSNGYRVKLWKTELQKLATEIGKTIQVSHFPPGTSKWNKIEHRLFSFISQNWRGQPLRDHATIVQLIGNTTTTTGLTVKARLDETVYEKGIKVSDEELAAVKLEKDAWHGEWNYRIRP